MNDFAIDRTFAWEALDSRGKPTVACEVRLRGGATGQATVPSGASTGSHEAHELRDGGDRYAGLGARKAVENVNAIIGPAVGGLDAMDQVGLDENLCVIDGTEDLSSLGANAVLSVSLATALAAAEGNGTALFRHLDPQGPALLPMPMINIISGGAHAAGAVDLQDFLAVPVGAQSFSEAIEWCWRVRRSAVEIAIEKSLPVALVADEGGLGPPLATSREALELLTSSIERSGFAPWSEVAIAIDVAATQLISDKGYFLATEEREITGSEWLAELVEWQAVFPICSIEDPFGEDDWETWEDATGALSSHVQLLGDDLFATNRQRLQRGIDRGIANAVLIKPNQAGTLSRAMEVTRLAQSNGYRTVVSARSGDTEDGWLSDLAVGWRAGQIKVGSLTRSERTAKWNRLLRIEAELGEEAEFAGRRALAGYSQQIIEGSRK